MFVAIPDKKHHLDEASLSTGFRNKSISSYVYVCKGKASDLFLALIVSQNDVLVLENLSVPGGYRKYPRPHLTDLDHCRVVLRRLAHFHAISTLIQVRILYFHMRLFFLIFFFIFNTEGFRDAPD